MTTYDYRGDEIVAPFDWSWEKNGNFDYNFFIAQCIAGAGDIS